ncbi:Hypothetical predicted protein [Cloeon dipterum]|uniref:NAD-dependent protein deacylase n=1 Tax=Cloeon dipterum TaxID=197152 RepID=A0A8S1C5A5_9INSE|nr:Hypothetical predicted protein [Cloeon dipterum]
MSAFKEIFKAAKRIVILSGAGISAESGIPTFRGSGGFWRTYRSQDLASYGAFRRDPSLVWEFYHYRRELVFTKKPNAAHQAVASLEAQCNRQVTVITQNVDGLHQSAGSKNVIELHGSLFKTRCLSCGEIKENKDSPICPALEGRGAPEADAPSRDCIPEALLPRCKKCSGLLRPHIVWFGENLETSVLAQAGEALDECDLCLVIGTSSVVYPAAMFAPQVAERGVPVAEFNMEPTPATHQFMFHFEGPCGTTVPEALKLD